MLKNKLKSWRHRLEMNQTEFAQHLGYTIGQYNLWENQKRQPDLENAWQIARKLNCTINDLFEEV
jgi:DNA-binding XRE family transcriptional regulator